MLFVFDLCFCFCFVFVFASLSTKMRRSAKCVCVCVCHMLMSLYWQLLLLLLLLSFLSCHYNFLVFDSVVLLASGFLFFTFFDIYCQVVFEVDPAAVCFAIFSGIILRFRWAKEMKNMLNSQLNESLSS